jgi:protein-S-isoprenylcysteine O-methyltransferase Ste14
LLLLRNAENLGDNRLVEENLSFFDSFQIASVAAFLAIVIARIFYLRLRKSINPIAIGGGKTGLVLAIELISFIGLVVWILEVLLVALHSPYRLFPSVLETPLFSSDLVSLIACAVVTFGLVVFLLAFVSFGDSWRIGFDTRTPGALVTTGVFAYTRNPIYVGMILWFFGIFLINRSLIFLIFLVLAIAAVHWQIRQEENFLIKLYGKPYEDYLRGTARYLFR